MLYRRETQYIKQQVAEFGKPVHYIYHIGQYLPDWHPWENYKNFFVGNARTGGVREIFGIDLPWLLDAFGDVESVTVQKDTISDLGLPYPDCVTLLLRHKGGVQGVLAADVVSRKAVRSFECFGDGIHLFWEGNPKALYEFKDGDKRFVNTYASFEHDSRYSDNVVENAYVDELTNFFGVLKGDEQPKWSFEKDLKAIELMDFVEKDRKGRISPTCRWPLRRGACPAPTSSKSKQRGSPMRTITALFVGLGSIGTRHLKKSDQPLCGPGLDFTGRRAAQRPVPPAAGRRGALLHAQYTDLADAPAHYDMVFITNPTSLHADALTRVRGRGGALFIEKADFFPPTRPDWIWPTACPWGKRPMWPRPCGGAVSCWRSRTGCPACTLLCAGHLLKLSARLAARRGLPHGLQRPQGDGRRRDDRPHPRMGLPRRAVRRAGEAATISRAPTPTSKSTPTICRCISPDTPHCWPRCISTTLAADTGAASSFSAMTAAIWPTLARAR